jgi:beta-lactam-binding protein with PASTA domain
MNYNGYPQGPGWFAVLTIAFATSVGVVGAFYWAIVNGHVPMTMTQQPVSEAAKPARGELVKVPSLVGLPATVAGELLQARGLRLVVQERKPDDKIAAEAVVSQQPLAESALAVDSPVSVTISTGQPSELMLPDLAGRSLAEARQTLESLGLVMGPVAGPSDGVVKSSEPAAGQKLAPGSMVGLSLEPGGVEVPKVVGMGFGKAKSTLEKAGFKLGKVKERFVEEIEGWVVLEQTPAAGEHLAKGGSVDLVRNESY